MISLIAVFLTVSLMSCSVMAPEMSALDLMEGYEMKSYPTSEVAPSAAAVDFALRLLSAAADNDDPDGKGVVISPFSILSALALTANGAAGDTLSEMEEAMGFDLDELNAWLPAYAASLTSGDKAKFTSANSI